MDDMLHYTAAVARGATNAFVVGDRPFMSYQASLDDAVANAGRFLKEAGAGAVKLEGAGRVTELVARLTSSGAPVMGHLELTPQSVHQLGGFRVQGRSEEAAEVILAGQVTSSLEIPTIGIGAGAARDGQVLVFMISWDWPRGWCRSSSNAMARSASR